MIRRPAAMLPLMVAAAALPVTTYAPGVKVDPTPLQRKGSPGVCMRARNTKRAAKRHKLNKIARASRKRNRVKR